ncbi:disulfide bond formation protein B [Sphingomonas jatrophae]|uniref:Disulfide bond formation protein DsbB n=1 Tax=Sphingomonas jatrophae TaxID=1166337 RepID=A0A1I6KXS2_9SPHN|nr:disulfide bond formation protein B [Sphingomonas jatrophae]SFR96043.1 Disulfide bond formation protein DsbB [Sphingomonas jatrophae]
MNPSLRTARALALILPAALLVGAWGSQLIGGLYPCEMCHWQRWPHYAAVVLALAAFARPRAARPLVLLAAVAILVSGAIGVFHAGVEYRWWEGITRCARPAAAGGDLLREILATPLVRCDTAQWTLFGISLAGFNALFSLGGGIAIVVAWIRSFR